VATLVTAGLVIVAGLAVVLLHLNETHPVVVVESKDTPLARTEPELLPPASKGQRYPREYVRYCHFQEERLRIVKQDLKSQEDIRAYNALASDYNSRCSDFFYQDEDLRIVKDEVIAKQKQLEADALRILSTWPWHATSANPNPVK
jgi:hypothetical protein